MNAKLQIIMDIDQTMVHCEFPYDPRLPIDNDNQFTFELGGILYLCTIRPGLYQFLETLSPYADFHIFTSATTQYAMEIIKKIDFKQKYFQKIFTQSHVNIQLIRLPNGQTLQSSVKNIEKMFPSDYNPKRTILIDDIIENFVLQPENGILIPKFYSFNLIDDNCLFELSNYILQILIPTSDVRPILQNKYKLYLHFTNERKQNTFFL